MDLRKLVLHVERVVLNGFQPQDRAALADSLRSELVRHLARPGAGNAVSLRSDTSRVDVAGLTIPRTLKPEEVGAWVARAVARGLTT